MNEETLRVTFCY